MMILLLMLILDEKLKNMKTPLEKAKEEFEKLKNKATKLQDLVYLDGVLAVLDSLDEYEKEFIKQLNNDRG